MSDSQAYEEVQLSAGGVTVTKRFEEDEFPVPAIAFEFVSDREETVTVTLSDEVPESVAVEDLGFHPEYGSEHWAIDQNTITFEREFVANAEYTTVYGIRATGAEDVEEFLTEPAIETVVPPLSEGETAGDADGADELSADEIVPESGDDIVKDVISGEGEVPGLEADEDDADEAVETLDLKDPNAPADGGTTVTADNSGDTTAADEDTPADAGADSVISAMAAEIRQDEAPLEDLKLVQRAIERLSDRDGSPGSTGDGVHDARVETLQRDVADLRAYTDALESFLEDEGTGDQLVREFESQLDEFDRTLGRVQSELSEATAIVSDVRTEMDDVTTDVDGVSETVADVEESVSELEASLESVESSVGDLEAQVTDADVAGRLDGIEDDLQELRDWQEQIKATFSG